MNNISGGLAFRVGLLMVVATALIIGLFSFFRGQYRNANTYRITVIVDDAQGIAKQDKVYLAGVAVGEVRSVNLSPDGRKALIDLQILNEYNIPVGSEFLIISNLLSGEANIEIIPPSEAVETAAPDQYIPKSQSGVTINGDEGLGETSLTTDAAKILNQFDKTASTADTLLAQLSKTVASANKVITDPRLQTGILSTVKNINLASDQGLLLTKQLRQDVALDNLQVTSTLHNVDEASASVNEVAASNRGKLNDIIANLDKATTQVAELTQNANQTLNKGGAIQNLSDTAASLKEAMIKLNSIESDIKSITSDPQMQADLRTTLHNTAAASSDTKTLVARLNALTGSHPSPFGRGDLKFDSRLDFTQDFRTNKFRTDFNVYAPFSSTDFGLLGIYDLTGDNKLDLEFGQADKSNKLLTYRAGVYDGFVGVGADYDLFGDHNFSADLFNPNRPTMSLRQRIPLHNAGALYIGLEDFPRTNAVTLGYQLSH